MHVCLLLAIAMPVCLLLASVMPVRLLLAIAMPVCLLLAIVIEFKARLKFRYQVRPLWFISVIATTVGLLDIHM